MFHQRRGPYRHRLTKLYSDTKQSYESARVTAVAANVNDDPEIIELRRDFQIQQDRLLAWGMHWADVEAHYEEHGDPDIDKKIDQAGLGEVVASVMSEIKRLLDESGRLQHPEKYEYAKSLRSMRSPPSPGLHRKEWTMHELKTGRVLLDQLTTCIDVLYSLSESRRPAEEGDEKGSKRKKQKHNDAASQLPEHVNNHPLYLVFDDIDFDVIPTVQSTAPPPYEAPHLAPPPSERKIAFHRASNAPILIDYLPPDCSPHVLGGAEDVFELHELGEKLTRSRALSWNGHLRLLGFTVDINGPRCAMVYALPSNYDYRVPHQHRSLAAAIAASSNLESSLPALEDRFRLAYNLNLSLLGYFVQDECHRNVNSLNVMFIEPLETTSNTTTYGGIRRPYLLQPSEDFVTRNRVDEPLASSIYRHPLHDPNATDVLSANDIYSLGLVLLEIGLWLPLNKLWKPKYNRTIFMERVQRIYSRKLASKCGSKYMKLVQKCLDAPHTLATKSEASDAGAFLLDVAKELMQCCVLDEGGPPPTSDLECFELLIIEQLCKLESLENERDKPTRPITPPPAEIEPVKTKNKRTTSTRGQEATKPDGGVKKWTELDIPQQDLDDWNTVLLPRLSKILTKALQDSPESCSLSLMMTGATRDAARTTICIQCPSTARVFEALKKRFKPKKGWAVCILNGEVRRSGRRKKPKRPRQAPKIQKANSRKPQEQFYQTRPNCGASIGCFKDNEHLPPVSFGGTILIDGEPFGMTVHHMLDDPSDAEDETIQPTRSSAAQARMNIEQYNLSSGMQFAMSEEDLHSYSDLDISEDDDGDDSSDSEASTIRPDYSIIDEDGNEFWFLEDGPPEMEDDEGSDDDDASSSSSDDEADAASIGDKFGIGPYCEEELYVTQPAIDDVDDDFFPSPEDRDDDHLASHSFGYVHASSGIRRIIRGDMKHEVDWALIRVNEDRLTPENQLLPYLAKTGSQPSSRSNANLPHVNQHNLTTIAPSNKLGGMQVHCRGRSSGFKTGRISQAMSYVKLHGRRSFSSSWCVDGGFGIPGDSGAWVYNPLTGELCGHVLAWGDKTKTAYIAPMEVLFEDIKARLGVGKVELPCTIKGKMAPLPKLTTVGVTGASKEIDLEVKLKGMSIQDQKVLASDDSKIVSSTTAASKDVAVTGIGGVGGLRRFIASPVS